MTEYLDIPYFLRRGYKGEIMNACDKCDSFGSKKTYENQAQLPLNNKVVSVDWCIHHIVSALNVSGIKTLACCCGHGEQDGSIVLADGRELVIRKYVEVLEAKTDG